MQVGSEQIFCGNLIKEIGTFGSSAYDSFGFVRTYNNGAGEIAGSASAYGLGNLDDSPMEGDIYVVHIIGLTVNSGEDPYVDIDNSFGGAQQITDGDSELTFTIKASPVGAAVLRISNTDASDWTCGQINVFKVGEMGVLPKGTYYVKLIDGTNTWYSEWFSLEDVYKNLMTSWGSDSYDTFVDSGTKIISAVTAAGDAAYSNNFGAVANDEEITAVLFLTLKSGELPTIRLSDANGTVSNAESLAEGLNVITLTATKATTVNFQIRNTAASNFSTSEILVIRKSCNYPKLTFSNTKDLGTILYQGDYENSGWVKATLKHGQHETEIIASEVNGQRLIEETINKQIYILRALLTKFQYQLLQTLPGHDSVVITDKLGNDLTALNIEVGQPQWFREYCRVDIRFTTEDDISIYRINEDNMS